jgi:hypothetical protein
MNADAYWLSRLKRWNINTIVEVPDLDGKAGKGKVTAWTVKRTAGGRGFSTTMSTVPNAAGLSCQFFSGA